MSKVVYMALIKYLKWFPSLLFGKDLYTINNKYNIEYGKPYLYKIILVCTLNAVTAACIVAGII